jgi:hypothetical protein
MECFIKNRARDTWYVVCAGMGKCTVFLTVFVPLITYHVSFLSACPLCKDSLTTGMAKGFFWSILLMLAVPVAVVGTIAGVIWRASRRRGDLPGSHPE